MTIFHGIEDSEGIKASSVRPEPRTLSQKGRDMLRSEMPAFICFMSAAGIIFAPSLADIIFLFSVIVWLLARSRVCIYPYDTPMDEIVKHGPKKGSFGKGMFFLGNDRTSRSGVWLSDDAVRTHWLVMGSTGSGKTRFLLGVLYQALLTGSGALYVDGKADTTVYWLVYSICRRLGREDDLLVINYLTGGENQTDIPYHKRNIISNTTNPFAYGKSDNLRSMIVSLMRDDGGDGMWKGRASALVGALMKTLCYMRDANMIQLSIMTLRKYLNLDEIVKIVFNNKIPFKHRRPLISYLNELPGYQANEAKKGNLNPKCYEQHGYLQMQLTEALADMSEVYGHIFATPMGEVDYKDLVFNRRILFVMLPALEKDPDALANLGKMVVGGVRSALAPALGNLVEGSKRDVIEVKPTTSFSPFYVILDEYGYYAVKGFANVAAQARSLGISCVFAGQDYPSFKKASEEEAASTVANTNVKLCLKLEDPNDTFQLFEKRAGKGRVSEISGYEMNKGLSGGYNKSQESTRIDMRERIDVRDLVSQGPGQAHIIFGDTLVRAQLFYADPFEVSDARLNRFVVVLPPTNQLINKYRKICEDAQRTTGVIKDSKVLREYNANRDSGAHALRQLSDDLNRLKGELGATRASIYAYGCYVLRNIKPEAFDMSGDDLVDDSFLISDESIEDIAQRARDAQASTGTKQAYHRKVVDLEDEDDDLDAYAKPVRLDRDAEFEAYDDAMSAINTKSMRMSSKAYASLLSKAVDEMVFNGIESQVDRKLTEKEREEVSVKGQLQAREEQIGLSADTAEYEARRGENMLIENVRYPVEAPQVPGSQEMFHEKVGDIASRLKRLKETGVS